jgi:hypothetical protein
MLSPLAEPLTGNTSFNKAATRAKGINEAHFVSKYSISGLTWPFSQVRNGRNVAGPSAWHSQRFHRGLATSTEPKTVAIPVVPESLVVYRRLHHY